MSTAHSRLHVNLTPKATEALDHLAIATGLNKTDVVNRALQFYWFVEQEKAAGNELALRNPKGQIAQVTVL